MLQFAENLSDPAVADAARTRIEFKYALGLELEDAGFDYSILCEFRARLAEGDAADRLRCVAGSSTSWRKASTMCGGVEGRGFPGTG